MELTTKQKLEALTTAYKTRTADDERGTIIIFNDESAILEDIKDIQYKLHEDTRMFELDYEIMRDACDIVSDIDEDDLENADVYELSNDIASVYTADRLSWLGIYNQDEITDISKEYGCDIATACAAWYEQKVAYACTMLIEWATD